MGEFPCSYPVVEAQSRYLWPQETETPYGYPYPHPGWYDPGYGPWYGRPRYPCGYSTVCEEVIPMRYVSLPILLLLVTSCASTPAFNTAGVDRALTPQRVSTSPQSTTGRNVQWGGTIVSTTNLKDSTQIEVLSFPLDSDGRPRVDTTAQGRFILERAGYLEPADYAAGRQVTAVGTVTGTLAGKVGEADYTYPVISARQLYLWSPERSYGGGSSFFGFGVGSGGGGSWGSGVGVGIGF